MNINRIKLILIKDLFFIVKNKRIFFPFMITPLMLLVFTPFTLIHGIKTEQIELKALTKGLTENLPSEIVEITASFTTIELIIYLFANYMMAVLFIMLPLMITSSISVASMIKEKENKTLETLLYSPLTKYELFVGKIIGSFIPSILTAYVGFLLYGFIIYLFTYEMFGYFILESFWIPLLLLLMPTAFLFIIIGNILVSAKAKNMQEAQQFSMLLTFPFILMVTGQLFGSVFINSTIVITLSVIFTVINLILIKVVLSRFTNESMLKL